MIRQPICVFLGHVDHGKTTLQDFIRRTSVAKGEAGAITQMISSSTVAIGVIKNVCKKVLNPKMKLTIPGILFIDTPGHAAFSNLRKRGGNLADIAVLVIDVNEGIMPQTQESIEVLKAYKTPFVVALNKVDKLTGWHSQPEKTLLESLASQQDAVKTAVDNKLYEIVGKLYELGFTGERFDRIEDFTKQVAMVPCSAKTGEGVPELLMTIVGLAQRFLEGKLETDEESEGKATVLEVKEEKGVGTALDIVLYDGVIRASDTIVIGGIAKPIVTKIRGLMQAEKGKLKGVKEAHAAAGLKVVAPDIKEVVAGMPLVVANKDVEEAEEEVQKEIEEVLIDTDNEGVVVKAESVGSLEALIGMLRDRDIEIKKASVGQITKKDIADASSEEDPIRKVILAFNVASVEVSGVKVIASDVIYKIIEGYEEWKEEQEKLREKEKLAGLTKPAKMQILRGCVFRQNNPCIVGVRVISGTLKADVDLIKLDGSKVGHVKSLQCEQETVKEAAKDKEVAVSIPGVTAGRQINEDDILIVDVPENNFKQLKELKKLLSPEEIELLKELAELKRKQDKMWGF